VLTSCHILTGYKLGEKKTTEELAALDAGDESLAKWKASLGIGAGGSAHVSASGPQVRLHIIPQLERSQHLRPTLLMGGCDASTETTFYD
jgi:hypothetical protein